MFIFERETHTHTQSVSRGGEEREGDKNPKKVPGSELSAQSQMQVSNPGATRS